MVHDFSPGVKRLFIRQIDLQPDQLFWPDLAAAEQKTSFEADARNACFTAFGLAFPSCPKIYFDALSLSSVALHIPLKIFALAVQAASVAKACTAVSPSIHAECNEVGEPLLLGLFQRIEAHRKTNIGGLLDNFTPTKNRLTVRQFDLDSDQFFGLDFTSAQQKTTVNAEAGDGCLALFEHSFPTRRQVDFNSRSFSCVV